MSSEAKPNALKPRWRKVVADFWGDKTRSILVISSIAAGVFAVGMIISSGLILREETNSYYAAANPPNIEITTDLFSDDFVRVIEKVPGVEDVEGRRVMSVRTRKVGDNWQTVSLVGIDDLTNSKINQVSATEGTLELGRDGIAFSEDFINSTGYQVGDVIEVESPDKLLHNYTVVALVVDQTTTAPDPSTASNGFITMNAMRAMGMGSMYNKLFITVDGDGGDEDYISEVAADVETKIENNGRHVYHTEENVSTLHPMADTILAVMGVLGALGVLVTLLSASLIINTLNALLTQQLRQIGVMKLIGGRSYQILGMYIILIVTYSLIALIIAIPFGAIAGYGLASLMAKLLGAVVGQFQIIPIAIVAQVLIAFIIPLGTGFFPINRGAKTNVRRAISNYRPEAKSGGNTMFQWGARWLSWVSRPIMLSIRNTFRKKGRLLLTVFTLTIAGAVFIAVFNVRSSMDYMMDQLMSLFLGDVTITLSQPYPMTKVERDLMSIPGVAAIEGWGGAYGDIVDADDEVVTPIAILAPPQDTKLLTFDFVAGRWLNPHEEKAMIVSDTIYDYYPDLEPGDQVLVQITDMREEPWTVVGIFRYVAMFGDTLAYADYDFITDKMNMPNQSSSYRITSDSQDPAALKNLINAVDQKLKDRGYAVSRTIAGAMMQESATVGVNALVLFLLIMAILTAFVGSIGLTGTMSISVLERTREIGVMRTIGAIDSVIMQSVIIEALVIGSLTWLMAIGLSYPISSFILKIIGESMAGSSFPLKVTPLGTIIWLVVVIILSIVASIMPARNAAKLTINEVLAYE